MRDNIVRAEIESKTTNEGSRITVEKFRKYDVIYNTDSGELIIQDDTYKYIDLSEVEIPQLIKILEEFGLVQVSKT